MKDKKEKNVKTDSSILKNEKSNISSNNLKNDKKDEKKLELKRKELINTYNQQNKDDSYIVDKKVTDEDIKKCKSDFEKRMKDLNEKEYIIADKNNAIRVAKFLQKWNKENVQWMKNLWVGVIKFDEFIENFISEYEKQPKDFIIEYGPLSYLNIILMNPSGIGLESAKYMKSINEEYSSILEIVGENMDWFQKEKKICDKLQERWATAEQGYLIEYVSDMTNDYILDKNINKSEIKK